MAAGRHQSQKGRLELVLDMDRRQMALPVVDCQQRFA